MFTYRQLILAVIISSAKIIFADILLQPVSEHQDNNNPSYPQYQPVSYYTVSSATRQYAKQLAEQLKQHLSEVQIVQPYYVLRNKVQSDVIGYPRHSHYMSKRPIGKYHYVKLGSRGYKHPSIFITHPYSAVHYRHKRSTDFTNAKSSKPAIADVATKPSLIDIKNPTVDSLLPENEFNNTNDKKVKNRQSDFATKPFLFGLDPNKMNSKFQAKNIDETEHSLSKRHHTSLITPVYQTQCALNSAKEAVTEPMQQMLIAQEKEQNQEPSGTNHENLRVISNVHSTNLEQSSSPITTPQMKSSAKEAYNNYYGFGSPWSFLFPSSAFSFRPVYTPIYSYEYNPNRRKYMYQTVQNRLKKKSSQETTNFIVPARNDKTANNKPFNEESSRSEIIVVPNSSASQAFYTFPYYTNYYLNDYLKDNTKDYLDNLETDYQDYDYDDKYAYLTDGYQTYTTKNSAYLPNVPSNKIYDDTIYGNSNIAPMTHVVSDIPQKLFLNSYYYPKKATCYS